MNMKKICDHLVIIFGSFLLIVAAGFDCHAQVPQTINYQGYLTDDTGNPVEGIVQMTFGIYNADTGGTALWSETHSSVQVNSGIYSVVLGTVDSAGNPLNLPFDVQYYLGITVAADAEMAPRQVLTAVPYALTADTIDGVDSSEFAASSHTHSGDDITTGTISLSDSNTNPVIEGSNTGSGYGLEGTTVSGPAGVWGFHSGSGNSGYLGGSTDGVVGHSTVSTYAGVRGSSSAAFGYGVEGMHSGSSNYGRLGTSAYGVLGSSSSGLAGYFEGDVSITGDLAVTGSVSGMTETDPVFSASPANGITGPQITGWDTAYGWGNHADAGYLTVETDPEVGANVLNYLPRWDGGALVQGSIYDNGNVGIGTTTPSERLSVAGNATVSGIIESTGGGVKFPDGSVQTTASSPLMISQVPQANIITTVSAAGDMGLRSSLTIGSDGLPVISYYDSTSADLEVLKCGNMACSSGNTNHTVASSFTVGSFSAITIGTDGLPIIAYYYAYNADLIVLKCGNSDCSSGNAAATVDSTGNVGMFPSITIGLDGRPVISYYDNTNSDLKVVKCGNAICSSSNTITTVDSSGDVGRYTSIAMGPDGLPVISYFDYTNRDLKVVKCWNYLCSLSNSITTVDSSGDVGQYSSIAIGADSLPVISYYDGTNSDLKVVKCGNRYCSSGNTISTIYSTSSLGEYSSITIGTDGLPVISSYNNTDEDLSIVKCGNASCSSGNTVTTVDYDGNVGQHTSIAMGVDGLPVMSYYDVQNGDLKVAKCANSFCVNNWTRR